MDTQTAQMPGWNLALRFGLEIAAWTGFAWGGWQIGSWPLGIGLLALTVVAWGTFAVPDDPGRNGKAPVPVPGVVRLILEVAILFGGAAMFLVGGAGVIAVVVAVLTVVNLVFGMDRTRWLLGH